MGEFAYWMGVIAAFITAFYSWRLIIMTFHGKPRADHHTMEHVHESPLVMTLPLGVLAIGAAFAGFIGEEWFAGEGREHFWGEALKVLSNHDSIAAAHHVELWVKMLPLVAAFSGIFFGYLFYMIKPDLPGKFVAAIRPLHQLVFRKYYFDEIYDAVFVKNAFRLGAFFWKRGDEQTIDAFGPDGVAAVTGRLAGLAGKLQTGYLYHYAFAMVIGLAAFVTWFWIGL